MNWRWIGVIGSLIGFGILQAVGLVFFPRVLGAPTGFAFFMAAMISALPTALIFQLLSESRFAKRQDELKKPFGPERVQILNQKWRLEDLRKKLSNSYYLDQAIQKCDQQLTRIDRAIVSLYEGEYLTEQSEVVEQIEEVVRRTKQDLQASSVSVPVPERARH